MKILIIGGGPAGLTAALECVRRGVKPLVLERDDTLGGIARTVDYKGYKFDIGGHRFFTKSERVMRFWQEILGADFLKRPRLSRISYRGRFFDYPLKLGNVVATLGLVESFRCFLSFIIIRFKQKLPEDDFETYIVNRFGWRLYNTFFKSYTEKVWGIPCREIRAEWAAQRIQGVSFTSAVRTALFGNRGNAIKSLIEEFFYPKEGPGMLWERVGKLVEDGGGEIVRSADVMRIEGSGPYRVSYRLGEEERVVDADVLVSTAAVRDLLGMMANVPAEVSRAASELRYRDFLTVGLIVDAKELWPDNWIYIHDPSVKVGRIQNYKNWSPYMVPDQRKSGIGLEYFVFENDQLWGMPDQELIRFGEREIRSIGLLPPEVRVEDGVVIRMRKTYPIYDDGYQDRLSVVRAWLEARHPQMILVGRNGMHRYNNQDHSMLTAMLAVENLLAGGKHDLWSVNLERVYHEEVKE